MLIDPIQTDRVQKVCSRCVLDTTVPDIKFDEEGVCNYCHAYDITDQQYPNDVNGQQRLAELVEKTRKRNINKEYDCLIGVSGGTDSTYLLYWAKKVGLRPLAVHFDNGWNTDIAVRNIKKSTTILDIDLYTYVVDWEEFKSLQVAYLKASTPDADKPTDIGLRSTLYRVAANEGIDSIMVGVNFRNEGKVPIFWSYGDGRYLQSVNRRYGTKPLNSFPNFTMADYVKFGLLRSIKQVRPLWYLDYRKTEVKPLLEQELDWEYYGGHHHENIYTRFLHGFFFPTKFGIDKRKVEYSALIRSEQLTREKALEDLQAPPYPTNQMEADKEYVIKKLDLSEAEFQAILSEAPKTFLDYSSYYHFIKRYRRPLGKVFEIIYSSPPQIFNYLDS